MNIKKKLKSVKKYFRTGIAFVILFAMIISLLSPIGVVFAGTITTDDGIVWNYTLSNGNATNVYTTSTVSGKLTIPAFINTYPVVSIGGNIDGVPVAPNGFSSVVIPGSVTTINSYAFKGITSLSGTFFMPNTISNIGAQAFMGCSGITNLNLMYFTGSLGTSAFTNCTGLTSLYVGNIASFGDYAFKGCTGLTGLEVDYPTLKNQFQDCSSLKDVVLDATVQTVGSDAFTITNLGGVTSKTGSANVAYGTPGYLSTDLKNTTSAPTSSTLKNVSGSSSRNWYFKNPNTVLQYQKVASDNNIATTTVKNNYVYYNNTSRSYTVGNYYLTAVGQGVVPFDLVAQYTSSGNYLLQYFRNQVQGVVTPFHTPIGFGTIITDATDIQFLESQFSTKLPSYVTSSLSNVTRNSNELYTVQDASSFGQKTYVTNENATLHENVLKSSIFPTVYSQYTESKSATYNLSSSLQSNGLNASSNIYFTDYTTQASYKAEGTSVPSDPYISQTYSVVGKVTKSVSEINMISSANPSSFVTTSTSGVYADGNGTSLTNGIYYNASSGLSVNKIYVKPGVCSDSSLSSDSTNFSCHPEYVSTALKGTVYDSMASNLVQVYNISAVTVPSFQPEIKKTGEITANATYKYSVEGTKLNPEIIDIMELYNDPNTITHVSGKNPSVYMIKTADIPTGANLSTQASLSAIQGMNNVVLNSVPNGQDHSVTNITVFYVTDTSTVEKCTVDVEAIPKTENGILASLNSSYISGLGSSSGWDSNENAFAMGSSLVNDMFRVTTSTSDGKPGSKVLNSSDFTISPDKILTVGSNEITITQTSTGFTTKINVPGYSPSLTSIFSKLGLPENDFKGLADKVTEISNNLKTAQDNILMYQTTIAEINAALSSSQADNSNLSQQNQSLSDQISSLQSDIDKLNGDISTLDAQKADYQKQLADLTDQNSQQAKDIQNYIATIDAKLAENSELLNDKQSLLQQNESLAQQNASLQADIDKLNGDISTLDAQKADYQQQLDSLSDQNSEQAIEIQKYIKAIDAQISDNTKLLADKQSLQQQLATTQASNDDLNQKLADTLNKVNNTVSALNQLQGQMNIIESILNGTYQDNGTDLSGIAADVSALQSKLTSTQNNATVLLNFTNSIKAKLGLTNDATDDDVINQINSLLDKMNADDSQVAELKTLVASLQTQNQSLQAQNQSLQSQVNTLKSAPVQTPSTPAPTTSSSDPYLQSQVSTLTAQVTSLDGKVSTLTETNSSLSTENASLKAENTTLTSKVASLSADNSSLKGKVTTLSSKVDTLQKSNDTLKSSNVSLQSDNDTLTVQLKKYSSRPVSASGSSASKVGSTTLPTGIKSSISDNNNESSSTETITSTSFATLPTYESASPLNTSESSDVILNNNSSSNDSDGVDLTEMKVPYTTLEVADTSNSSTVTTDGKNGSLQQDVVSADQTNTHLGNASSTSDKTNYIPIAIGAFALLGVAVFFANKKLHFLPFG